MDDLRETSQSASPPATPERLLSAESEAGTPPPPDRPPHLDVLEPEPEPEAVADPRLARRPAAESAATAPAKRRRLSETPPPCAELDLDEDLDHDLQREIEELRASKAALQRARNEARAKQAEDREWVARMVAAATECLRQEDPSESRRMLEDFLEEQGRAVAERRESEARLRDRSGGVEPMAIEAHEAKASFAAVADDGDSAQ